MAPCSSECQNGYWTCTCHGGKWTCHVCNGSGRIDNPNAGEEADSVRGRAATADWSDKCGMCGGTGQKDDEAYPGPWYNVMSSDLGMFCQCHALQTSRAVPGQHPKHRGTAFCAASEERMSGMSSSENPVGGRGAARASELTFLIRTHEP
ncbi:uncharacterized protein BO95DRAFT_459994 [Aspergillus brunneoviolaceus CBS 621.78]|uniref:Uncharacterized protein n=1 Tax=Aspergillus brunneoviolaceus CBS 621.78 TaxID=1450534 RepID=A0ACD1GK21_9EURO|nr:hypothetical protein BO95DRAFT_459994 [Aspergillus brunneoviolaceus CBS 621.78]RAH49602.1 hypothetical protein BO95DRAFT_459994 [Aspergillus brunneoviolaceus CBS 621.78]